MMTSLKMTRPGSLFWYFLKDLTQHDTRAKFHSQGLTSSGFMTRGPFGLQGYLMLRKPKLVRVNKQSSIVVTVNIFHDLSSVFSALYCGKCDSYFVTVAANIHITTAQTAETAENEISRYTNVIDSPEEFNKSFEHSNVSFEKILNFNF